MTGSGRVRLYTTVSCSASHREWRLPGNAIGIGSIRSRPTPAFPGVWKRTFGDLAYRHVPPLKHLI
jgi:hypothetical protein